MALQVVFLCNMGRSVDDEMARITQGGAEHAAAAWLRIAHHVTQAELQLQALRQVDPTPAVPSVSLRKPWCYP